MGIDTLTRQAEMLFCSLDKVCKTFIGGSIPPRASKSLLKFYAMVEFECEATALATRGSFTSMMVPVSDVRSMDTEPP